MSLYTKLLKRNYMKHENRLDRNITTLIRQASNEKIILYIRSDHAMAHLTPFDFQQHQVTSFD